MGRSATTSDFNQGKLFDLVPEPGDNKGRRAFGEPPPDRIFIGATPLRTYLEDCGQAGVLRLGEALRSLDWSGFEAQYAGPGRAPYAPRLMAGLVMYGLLKGISSLRGLESLSKVDLGCMWLCAGIQPDHSNIGRFIVRHAEEFEGGFFEQVTKLVLRLTNSTVADIAGDGTAVQAAASRYRTVKREALDRKLTEATKKAQQDGDDEEKAARQAKYAAADLALTNREEKRQAKGKPTDSLRVSTTEPEAPIQPLKNKSFAPSYKPSVLANDARVIVGMAVDPSDESSVVSEMLDQAEKIGAAPVERLLVDGNYCNETIINAALERDIDLLCPEHGESTKQRDKLSKSEFKYDEARDVYTCPGGQELTPRSRSEKGGYVQYERSDCLSCPLRARCFSKKSTRRVVRRLAVDEAKDALRTVMEQPRARVAYAKRKAMVEPVFSFMSGAMNLRRFRRRGLSRVRLEFSLYAAAYNLGRGMAALRRSSSARVLSRLVLWMHDLWQRRTHMRRLRPAFSGSLGC